MTLSALIVTFSNHFFFPSSFLHVLDWHREGRWAFGSFIFELLSGRAAFESKDQMQLFRKIINGEVFFPRFVYSALSMKLGLRGRHYWHGQECALRERERRDRGNEVRKELRWEQHYYFFSPFFFCRFFSEEEQSIVLGLLRKDLTRRLGCMHGGMGDIRNHSFFRT